jgi:threonine/homoserine efflux transporter RhtA
MLIQYISITIEFLIAVMGLLIVFQKKKIYGWGIFVTFGIYVFYDLVRLMNIQLSNDLMYGLFFIATASAFWAIYRIYSGRKK